MYTVNVLMSTYNGEQYIAEQIESILEQKDVYTIITVRDDGSQDSTLSILYSLQNSYAERIIIVEGKNVGYGRSFLELLTLCKNADYYAFSDQDDVWLSNKLITAISQIEGCDDYLLYASSVEEVDADLKPIRKSDISIMESNLQCFFARARLAGCTFVFKEHLRQIVTAILPYLVQENYWPAHDFLCASCAFTFGNVLLDSQSFILHRRHAQSVTSGGSRIKKRIKTELNIIFKKRDTFFKMATLLLNAPIKVKSQEIENFLLDITSYKKSFKSKVKLLLNKKLTSHILICDLEKKYKILMGWF